MVKNNLTGLIRLIFRRRLPLRLLNAIQITMKRLFFHLLITLFLPLALFAQTAERPFAIGLWGGITQYNGDLGQGFYKSKNQDTRMHIGLTTAWLINQHFDFSMNATIGTLGYRENELKNFEADQLQWNAHVRACLFKEERFKINPYGFAGIGLSYLSNLKNPGTDIFIPFGAGLKISITERLGLLVQETFAYTDHDNRDKEEKDNNDAFLMHSLGLTWNFATVRDEDKDGVPDKKDKCPQTPEGTTVDAEGCPLDRDGDGISDQLDACPDVKGVASAKGCPDKDGDSVADSIDKCIEVAGLVTSDPATNGCPDQDGDGVTDADDRCPEIKGTVALKGCLDSDEDGTIDPDDRCPQEKGTAESKGCPDKDGDKVVDMDDKCPDTPGIEANAGCPAVDAGTSASSALQPVLFETGKATVRSRFNAVLKNAVRMMNENPTWSLEIAGHTDNTGGRELNEKLSQHRADNVKAALVKRGIAENRIITKGTGDSQPVGDNATSAGRTKNRRAELKIIY